MGPAATSLHELAQSLPLAFSRSPKLKALVATTLLRHSLSRLSHWALGNTPDALRQALLNGRDLHICHQTQQSLHRNNGSISAQAHQQTYQRAGRRQSEQHRQQLVDISRRCRPPAYTKYTQQREHGLHSTTSTAYATAQTRQAPLLAIKIFAAPLQRPRSHNRVHVVQESGGDLASSWWRDNQITQQDTSIHRELRAQQKRCRAHHPAQSRLYIVCHFQHSHSQRRRVRNDDAVSPIAGIANPQQEPRARTCALL
jgi:hypothetical protein